MKLFVAVSKLSIPGGILIMGWILLCRSVKGKISHKMLRLLGVLITLRLLFLFPIVLTDLPIDISWNNILQYKLFATLYPSAGKGPTDMVVPPQVLLGFDLGTDGLHEKEQGFLIARTLFSVWGTGAVIKAFILLTGHLYWHKKVWRWCRLPERKDLREVFDRTKRRLGMETNCILCINPRIKSPGVLGIHRKYLMLPCEIMPREWQEMVFAHELFHIRHRDLLVKILVNLAGILYWFHPLFYVLRRNLYIEMELACDEEVLETIGIGLGREYARMLLWFSGAMQPGDILFHSIGGDSKMLKTRIATVLDKRKRKSRPILLVITVLSLSLSVFSEEGLALDIVPGDTTFETICPDLSEESFPFIPALEFIPDETFSRSLVELLEKELTPAENVAYEFMEPGLITLNAEDISITLYPNQNGFTLASVYDQRNLMEGPKYYVGALSLYDEINQKILLEYDDYLKEMMSSSEVVQKMLQVRQDFAKQNEDIREYIPIE